MTASQHLIEEIERAFLKCARDRVQGRHHPARRLWRHTSCGEDDESGERFLSPVMGFPLAPRLIFLSPHSVYGFMVHRRSPLPPCSPAPLLPFWGGSFVDGGGVHQIHLRRGFDFLPVMRKNWFSYPTRGR